MRKLPIVVCMSAMTLLLGTTLVAPSVAGADEGKGGDSKRVRIFDDCDPATFNAAIEPGTCKGDGETLFGDFIAQLQATGAAKGWEFKPADFHIDQGDNINAVSRGGEFHTFTEVADFGGGCVEDLNNILGLTPVPECTPTVLIDGKPVPAAFLSSGVDAGGNLQVPGLSPGTHEFQCLIHPWMHAVVVVRADHGQHHG
jgi:plastocyanin